MSVPHFEIFDRISEKSGDHHSQQNSSSGYNECLYKMSQQSFKYLLRYCGPIRWINRQHVSVRGGLEGKALTANTRDSVELQHRPVNFLTVSSHEYLDHLSEEEKQRYVNKLQILGTFHPYTAPAAVFQSLKTAKSLPELHFLTTALHEQLTLWI